jgi:hypothetical protein
MGWKKTIFLLTLLTLLCASIPSYAQDYSFSMDKEEVDVWINPDGSVKLEYAFTFTCDPGAHPIDVVDLGLPTGDFDARDISGNVGDTRVSKVDRGDYQGSGSYGVAVWLGSGAIRPGETGTVRIVVERVGGMIYEDSDDAEYASTEFSPTWFSGQFVHGTTEMIVYFHLPEGVQAEEPRWHQSPSGWPQSQPDAAFDEAGRVVYTWYNASAAPDRQYMFGASYPRKYVDASAIQTGPSAIEQILSTITGALSCCCNPIWLFAAFIIGIIGLSVYGQRKRRMRYLPPSMKVEGVGIKRGLTAVESAILLETPLNKVLTMILFGLLKKGAITVLDDEPLKLEANEPLPELRGYEEKFLEAVKKDKTLSESKLRKMMVGLVKEVGSKMKGFSRKETVAYYKDIVKRAWQQIESAETPEVRSQRFDEGLEWSMLDDDFDDRVGRTFRTGPVYVPTWWGYHRPWVARTRSTATATPSRSSSGTTAGRVQLPTLPGAAFAATVVNGVQSTASRIVRNVTGFTGGVTQSTNPPPKVSSGGRYSSSGGSSCACACACACAGCACACAGGGR